MKRNFKTTIIEDLVEQYGRLSKYEFKIYLENHRVNFENSDYDMYLNLVDNKFYKCVNFIDRKFISKKIK